MHCPDAIGNPFLHLRLGQTQFKLGNQERAEDEPMRTYTGLDGEARHNENPKYSDFLEKVAQDIEKHKNYLPRQNQYSCILVFVLQPCSVFMPHFQAA